MPQQNVAPTNGPVRIAYDARIASGELEPDDAQSSAIDKLDQLAIALAAFNPGKRGLLRRLMGSKPQPRPRGLYMHGGVGRGKTMLMDLFHDNADFVPSLRMHFHEFMSETHDRIAHARRTVDDDPIPHVAAGIAPGPTLLCFDEFHVTDIADAMILGRLFRALFASGTILVTTSNASPDDLYRHGLNRQLFLPFIDMLEDNVEVHELISAKDFRLDKLVGRPLYFSPVDDAAKIEMNAHWERLSCHHQPGPMVLQVKGRDVHVPMAAMGVARFDFNDLCAKPLGPRDYLLIAHTFHTILIDNIPTLPPARRNEARRFINLIDAMYDNRVGLIASAAAEPDDLYPAGDGSDLFVRTASRLMEMRSPTYLSERDQRSEARDGLGAGGPAALL